MSSTRFRVPLARSLAVACATFAAIGLAQAEAPVAGPDDVRICGAEAKTSDRQDLALYQTADGVRLLKIPAAELAAELAGLAKSGSNCLKGTAAGLAVQFPGMPAIPTVGGVTFFPQHGANNFDIIDPVICENFGTAGQTLKFGFEGTPMVVSGWGQIRYELATGLITLSAVKGSKGPLAQCFVFPYDQTVESPPAGGPRPVDPNAIFDGSFENIGDVLVEILETGTSTRIGTLGVYPAVPFTYDVLVTNVGEAAVAGVAVREYLPALPRVLGGAVIAPVEPGNWTCSGANCPAANGSGKLAVDGLQLAPGDVVRFALERTVADQGDTGVLNVAAVAAFVDSESPIGGIEENPEDNAVPLVLSVQANQPPVVVCTPSSVSMEEDGTPVDVSCSITDAEGDPIQALTIDNAAAATASLLESAPLAVAALGNDTYGFTVDSRDNASGDVTLQLLTSDGITGPSQYNLQVSVGAVDDAPSFSVAQPAFNVYPDGQDHDGHFSGPVNCVATINGFNCEGSRLEFFSGFSAGAADESGQTVEPVITVLGTIDAQQCGTVTPGDGVSHFFAKLPEVLPASPQPISGTFAVRFSYKTTATGSVFCDFRFRDSGGVESAPVRVTFTVQTPPIP